MRSVTPPSALPGISPARGEIALPPLLSPIINDAFVAPALKSPISPLEGEMPGRAEGGAVERNRHLLIDIGNTTVPHLP
ncbi:MAG: hypothetical protein E5Y06_23890 [Mesorhizobium sp.]|nr:MAG: hypothetical protein E5Y06_23890 [Mesorhizobium sp.]TJU95144.1 MAG: hypothetical protein E5Y08_27300 [Mesorhizobium sp.]TJV14759.1 MAG: hypothetical protein E5Y07_25580 [Mesorhizobium sp.]